MFPTLGGPDNKRIPALIAPVVMCAILTTSGCHPSAQADRTYATLDNLEIATGSLFEPRIDRTALSFSFSPTITEDQGLPATQRERVAAKQTAWGTPWDRAELVRVMNDILIDEGIDSQEQRTRMIAHAIVASGWRQNVWNHNLWGVRQGSWDGKFFVMSTLEEDQVGRKHMVWNAAWRSFDSWSEAINDFTSRINPQSSRPSYRKAYKNLVDPDRRADSRYWAALGEGNYYTATHFSEKTFAMLCWSVRGYLEPT